MALAPFPVLNPAAPLCIHASAQPSHSQSNCLRSIMYQRQRFPFQLARVARHLIVPAVIKYRTETTFPAVLHSPMQYPLHSGSRISTQFLRPLELVTRRPPFCPSVVRPALFVSIFRITTSAGMRTLPPPPPPTKRGEIITRGEGGAGEGRPGWSRAGRCNWPATFQSGVGQLAAAAGRGR